MNSVSNQLKKSLGKEMASAMSSNYSKHGDSDSITDFMTTTSKLKKEVQEAIEDESLLDIAYENYYVSFFNGYRKELQMGKDKFIKAIVSL